MKPKHVLALSFAWLLCMAGWLAFYHEPDGVTDRREVVIVPGTSNRDIARLLRARGILPTPELFLLYLALSGQRTLQAGRYFFRGNESVKTLVDALTHGKTGMQRITFPEGLTSQQMADLLEQHEIANQGEYLALVADPARFSRPWLAGVRTLEGFLFPDTYYFVPYSGAETVINTQLDRFESLFLEEYRTGNASLSLSETVILASIVEKETKWSQERPLVASVFLNRLDRNMRLQSCATVVFALKRERGINRDTLTLADLNIESPFNTYRVTGLPPEPIANPGLASLQAVLHPVPSDYLFFVLNNDGRHYFSRTYEEHLANREAARP
ncbi:MAG TPA: endolytic transglycosylase MltG [Atribacteraceae bacterium]|nr:endolytic transglycosylase MltG [Atribacteraceae bacterium]